MITSNYISGILELLLDGDGKAVKPQLAFLQDMAYEYTGGGVVVRFSHTEEIGAYRLPIDKLVLNGVTIASPALGIGADATAFLTNGLLEYLEIWSFDGNYPDYDLTQYTLQQVWQGSSGRVITVNE